MLSEFLRKLHETYPLLSLAVWFNVGLLVLSLAALPFDSRQVAGINPWIKPIKFEVSVIVYVATAGWLLLSLPGFDFAKRFIAAGIGVAMIGEIACVVLQAARGVKSHFNQDSGLGTAIFGIMGLLIMFNTALIVWLTILYFVAQPNLAPASVWGIRLGLVLFLLASAEGALLVRNRAHTVGAADGGSGLFFLNWSTTHGDLRIAHFVGMHGIQILPLAGWLLSRNNKQAGVAVVSLLFAAILAGFVWALREALAGRPLWRA